MIVSLALVLSCFSFRSSGPYHRVDTSTPHALNLCEWTRTQQNIGQRHASDPAAPAAHQREKRKLTDWPDAAAMAATSITAWKTFMIALEMMKGRSIVFIRRWLENL